MNTMTARALMVGLAIALWAWVASVARLHVAMWAGVVALGCFFAAGGGVPGLQKTVVTTLAGVLWVLVSHAVRVAIFHRREHGAEEQHQPVDQRAIFGRRHARARRAWPRSDSGSR